MFAPAGTPAPVVERLNHALVAIASNKQYAPQFHAFGFEPFGSTPAELGQFVVAELQKWSRLVKDAAFRPNKKEQGTPNMNFDLSAEQQSIVEAVQQVCTQFDMEYWNKLDVAGTYPHEFYKTLCEGGWLGVAMPEQYGGAGLGILEAALVMQTISESGAGMSGASAVHMNVFGLNPVVVFGTDEQKARFLPPLIAGKEKACFGVTEPDAGLDTTKLKTFARKVPGGYSVTGRKIWISTAQVADRMLLLARTTRSNR